MKSIYQFIFNLLVISILCVMSGIDLYSQTEVSLREYSTTSQGQDKKTTKSIQSGSSEKNAGIKQQVVIIQSASATQQNRIIHESISSPVSKNPRNNASSRMSSPAGLPDLTVPTLYWAYDPVNEGDTYWIRADIKNAGTGSAGVSYAKAYLSTDNDFDISDDSYLGEKAVNALSSGATQTIQWDFNFPNLGSGAYPVWIVIVVDSRNQIAESDESNPWKANSSLSAKDPTALPDLTVPTLYWAYDPVNEGDTYWIRADIKNAGTGSAGVSYAKAYLSTDNDFDVSNDYYLGEKAVNALSSGTTQTIQWDFNFPNLGSGTYPVWIVIVVDSRNQITEADENNTWKCNTSFTAKDMVSAGALQVTVQNVDGTSSPLPGANAIARLYNSSNQQVKGDQPTNNNGIATFTDVTPGSGYYYKVYHNPNNPTTMFSQECWGQKTGITITAGQTTSETFKRNMPYGNGEFHVYNNTSNQEIPAGGSVTSGTQLKITFTIVNPNFNGSASQIVKGRVVIDRDETSSYDFDQTGSSQSVSVGNSVVFTYNYTPTQAGSYYRVTGTLTNVNGSDTYTDGWAWGNTVLFTVEQNSSPDIQVTPTSLTINQQAVIVQSHTWVNYVPAQNLNPSKMSQNEKHSLGLVIPDSVVKYWKTHKSQLRYKAADLLPSVDWSANDSPVKNQGNHCGSCWAFSAVALVENIGHQTDLSEQIIVSCSGGGNCEDGGFYLSALDYIQNAGLPPENCYGYLGTDGNCSNKCSQPPFIEKIMTHTSSPGLWGEPAVVNDIKAALQTSPLVVAMNVYEDFDSYTAGTIYHHASGAHRGRHAVLVVGYNDDQQCFKVKNSWGSDWGENGYFRISYSDVTGDVHFGSLGATASGAYTVGQTNLFVIQNLGTGTLSISSISANKNWLTTADYPSTPFNITPSGSQQVAVNVDWSLVGGTMDNGKVTIASNDPDEPSVDVQVIVNKTMQSPTIAVSVSSLPDFGNVQVRTNSTSKPYTVSGSNLTDNITITAPAGFQVSKDNSTFGSSVMLPQSGGSVSNTSIYARFSPTTTGAQSGNISHTSTSATPKSVSVSGTGIPVTTASSIKITSVSSTSTPPTYPKGTEFWVEVKVGDPNAVTDLYGVSFKIKSDKTSCTYVDGSAIAMDFLGASPLTFFQKVDNQTVDIAITKTSAPGVNGSGFVVKAKFTTPSTLSSETIMNFSLLDISATNSTGGSIILTPEALGVKIAIGTPVWPGDCDNNGVVNASDLLRIGLYYGQSWQNYPTANNPGTQWQEYLRDKWMNDLVPEKKIFADANGNGIINSGDVLAIGLNYGKTHTASPVIVNPITINSSSAERNSVSIVSMRSANNGLELSLLGDFTSSVYGLSMKLNHHFEKDAIRFSKNMVYSSIDTAGSLLGKSIQFVKQLETNYSTDLALTRIEDEGINGAGKIVTLHYTLPSDWSAEDQLVVDATDVIANDSQGNAIKVAVIGYHSTITAVKTQDILPTEVVLEQNYPNPFNPSTTIQYILPQPSQVRLDIYDLLGRHVTMLINESQNEGYHSVEWNPTTGTASSLSSGIYIYRLSAVNATSKTISIICKRMILNK